MACSKAKLKSSGDKASPSFRPFWIGKLSDKCLPIRTLLYVSFKLIDPLKMWHSSNNLGTTVTNQNLIQDEIMRRLNSGNT
jgi:hypothetical protein